MIKLNNQNTALHIYFCLVYLQCGHGEVAELVDATREFGTLLFTGLEIQWLPLYRLEPGLLHEYRFNSYSLTEVAEVVSALPFGRFSDRFDSTERRHKGGVVCYKCLCALIVWVQIPTVHNNYFNRCAI